MNPGQSLPDAPWVLITVSPHDPLVLRDGRPFGISSETGNRLYSLDWPYPQTMAGAIRTLIGRLVGAGDKTLVGNPFHDQSLIERLKATEIVGPFVQQGQEPYIPSPLDALVYLGKDPGERIVPLRPKPLRPGEGCDLPNAGLWPVEVPKSEKAGQRAQFWSLDSVVRWLKPSPGEDFRPRGIGPFPLEERVHLRMNQSLGRAADEMLFTTQGLVLPDAGAGGDAASAGTALVAFVKPTDDEIRAVLSDMDLLQPFGGEKRIASFKAVPESSHWACPAALGAHLVAADAFRMLLVTPAIFDHGWLPGWLDPVTLVGTPPSAPAAIRLRLRGACVERWQPVSGWSLERGTRGPKPVRRVVPSGSVYFFERIAGSGEALASLWMDKVSDRTQDRCDGYGAALWGVWEHDSNEGGFDNR